MFYQEYVPDLWRTPCNSSTTVPKQRYETAWVANPAGINSQVNIVSGIHHMTGGKEGLQHLHAKGILQDLSISCGTFVLFGCVVQADLQSPPKPSMIHAGQNHSMGVGVVPWPLMLIDD